MEDVNKQAPLDQIAAKAIELRNIQDQVSDLNGQLTELKKLQTELSDQIIEIASTLGDPALMNGFEIKNVGFVKLTTKPRPSLVSLESFLEWCESTKQNAPGLTINPAVLSSWYNEQSENNLPLPSDEILKVHFTTTARVNKGGK